MLWCVSIRAEFLRQRKLIEELQSENSALRDRVELLSGVVEELMKSHEDRR